MANLCQHVGSSISKEDWNEALELAERWKHADAAYGNPGKSLTLLSKAFLHLLVCYEEMSRRCDDIPESQ